MIAKSVRVKENILGFGLFGDVVNKDVVSENVGTEPLGQLVRLLVLLTMLLLSQS